MFMIMRLDSAPLYLENNDSERKNKGQTGY